MHGSGTLDPGDLMETGDLREPLLLPTSPVSEEAAIHAGGRRVQGIRLLLLMVKQVQPIAAGCRGYSRSFAGIFHITLLC